MRGVHCSYIPVCVCCKIHSKQQMWIRKSAGKAWQWWSGQFFLCLLLLCFLLWFFCLFRWFFKSSGVSASPFSLSLSMLTWNSFSNISLMSSRFTSEPSPVNLTTVPLCSFSSSFLNGLVSVPTILFLLALPVSLLLFLLLPLLGLFLVVHLL